MRIENKGNAHDRILLRLLQPLDLSRVPQHPAGSAKELGAEISWRPILVGGIFNTVNPSVYAQRETPVPSKARYMKKDLADWARSSGLAIKMPPTVFPVNSVKAMRGRIWLGTGSALVAPAVFETYWGDRRGHLAVVRC